MNIEQIKKDLANGVLVNRVTIVTLVEAALLMEDALYNIKASERDGGDAAKLLKTIEKM